MTSSLLHPTFLIPVKKFLSFLQIFLPLISAFEDTTKSQVVAAAGGVIIEALYYNPEQARQGKKSYEFGRAPSKAKKKKSLL